MKSRQQATAERPPAKRRGPKPSISDEALLVAIEADLEASPWEGEGHRKVWARLRVCRGIRVSRKRVLRVMRENNLLSPHRCRRRGGNPHVGEIITHAPNLMWGTDGVRVFTVDDGWGWIFTAIEQLPDPLHGDVQFRLHRIALALLERGVDPADRFLTPLLEPEDIYAQLARQKLHRLVTQKPQNDLTLARHRPSLAKSQRACRQSLAWGKRGRAKLARIYHRPINSNFLLKIIGHVPAT